MSRPTGRPPGRPRRGDRRYGPEDRLRVIQRLRRQGLSFGQIAKELGMTPQGAAYHWHYGEGVLARKREREEERAQKYAGVKVEV